MRQLVQELLEELTAETQKAYHFAKALQKYPKEKLNERKIHGSWTINECLEHLNRYGNFYLPQIRKAVEHYKGSQKTTYYRGSVMGNFFVHMIRLSEGKRRKMKTQKTMDPTGSVLDETTLLTYLSQQEELLALLEACAQVPLKRPKITTSLSRFVFMELGDTLRFMVYHNQRHIFQISLLLDP